MRHNTTRKYCLLFHCGTHFNQPGVVSFLVAWSVHNYLCGFVWLNYCISKTVYMTMSIYLNSETLSVLLFTVLWSLGFKSPGQRIIFSSITWIFTVLVCVCISFIFKLQLCKCMNIHKKTSEKSWEPAFEMCHLV